MKVRSLAGALALLPAMIGPLPAMAGDGALVLAVCGGGTVTIALGSGSNGAPTAPPSTACCAKGCHTSERRRLLDRGQ